jgi:hypothetical protein
MVALSVVPQLTAQTLGTHERVTMIFTGGERCVVVDKMVATIHRNRQPKQVEWAVTVPGRYWEIRYQESAPDNDEKPDGQGNFFATSGDLDIGCGEFKVRTEVPTVLSTADPKWPYAIKVYKCDDGVKGDFICELDPIIDWDG